MTAIAGIVRHDQGQADRDALERMCNVLAPYGKDAQHCRPMGSAGFVRTLLRITPEDALDQQPCTDTQSGWTLVFDGRIDNREALAQALQITPERLRGMADAMLVLQAWVRWETGCLPRLLGDFALAAWHPRTRRLMLARDYLGVRPLFWYRGDGFHAFASLPKALFAIPGVPCALSEEGVHDYLALLPLAEGNTLYKGIHRVMPGQCLIIEDGRQRVETWYSFDSRRELRLATDAEYVEAFTERLERAVTRCLRAVGPVASKLSSGFDSSTVTAVAAAQLAVRGERLLAFTSVPREGFDGPVPSGRHADEGPGAQAVAAMYPNIQHVLVRNAGASPLEGLEERVDTLDMPPFNLCNYGWVTSIRQQAAARGARVLLGGGMGNMTISHAGYSLLPELFGRGRWLRWQRECSALRRRHPSLRWRRLLSISVKPWVPEALWSRWRQWRGNPWELSEFSALNPALMAELDTEARARRAGVDLTHRDLTSRRQDRIHTLQTADFGEYALDENHDGLESRDPTADRELVEFCLAVPDTQHLRNGQTRWLLRRAMAGRLPAEILENRSRGLQAADWHEGAARDLPRLRETLARLEAHPNAGRYLDLPALKALVDAWPESGFQDGLVDRNYRYKLLRGLSVGAFIRHVENDNR